MPENKAPQNALRISQLDAGELDGDLVQILRDKLRHCFKYCKANWLISYEPELSAGLKLLLWKFTVEVRSATVGQQLLDLEYRRVSNAGILTRRDKILLAAFTIVGPWMTQRAQTWGSMTEEEGQHAFSAQIVKFVSSLEVFWKIASLVNFLVFLRQGKFQFLIERLIGIRAMFPQPQGVRQVGFEYMDRELLWHGFAEFLFFILPLVNFRKIKNLMMRSILSQSDVQHANKRCMADYKECVVCGEWPYNPHHIGCNHVFCYYCVQANYEADPGFSCPVCGQTILGQSAIVPVKMIATTVIDPT